MACLRSQTHGRPICIFVTIQFGESLLTLRVIPLAHNLANVEAAISIHWQLLAGSDLLLTLRSHLLAVLLNEAKIDCVLDIDGLEGFTQEVLSRSLIHELLHFLVQELVFVDLFYAADGDVSCLQVL